MIPIHSWKKLKKYQEMKKLKSYSQFITKPLNNNESNS